MRLETDAIVCAVRPHGEAGAIARLMTRDDGMVAGFVRGGRSRTMRPLLQPGNLVRATLSGRVDGHLPSVVLEPLQSRGLLMGEPLAADAIAWVCALAAASLPERHPYAAIHDGLEGVLAAIEAAPSARGWLPGLVRYEGLILAALGYGGGDMGLDETGRALATHLFSDQKRDVMAARERLIARLATVRAG